MKENTILEASIHKFKGNIDRSLAWLERIGVKDQTALKEAKYGDYLYFDGFTVEVIDNPQYKYE
jgi:hypothetical protein